MVSLGSIPDGPLTAAVRGTARHFVLALALLIGACGGSPASPAAATGAPTLTFTSGHFVFHHTAADAASITQTAGLLEAEYTRIVQHLGVATMPAVNVSFYETHEALVAGAGPAGGPIPAWATGLVTAEDQIHLLSPMIAGPYDRAITNLVHEFAHCVSLRANRTIANNPRWLWEAIAIFEAGQRVEPRSLAYMTAGQPPAFSRLNSFDNTLVYDVGYLVSEFVITRWSATHYRDLLAANGDTSRVLGLALADFEAEWFGWVRLTYGI